MNMEVVVLGSLLSACKLPIHWIVTTSSNTAFTIIHVSSAYIDVLDGDIGLRLVKTCSSVNAGYR